MKIELHDLETSRHLSAAPPQQPAGLSDLPEHMPAPRTRALRERAALLVLFASFLLALAMVPFTLQTWGIDLLERFGLSEPHQAEVRVGNADRGSSLAGLSTDDLVRLSIHGVSADYVREMAALGYRDLSVDDLVQLSIHGVRPGFVREMRALGQEAFSVEDLVQLSIHGVQPGFVREMQQLGYGSLPVSDLVQLSIHGVDARFVRSMQEAGYTRLSPEALIDLRLHGVDAAFARKMSG